MLMPWLSAALTHPLPTSIVGEALAAVKESAGSVGIGPVGV